MCGIVGAVAGMCGVCVVTREVLRAARDTMVHRGPDGAGLWESDGKQPAARLGHRRLAVQDLSEHAQQPMEVRGQDGRVLGVLVYNGELYNAQELARDAGLEATLARSDTRVLAHLLAREGEEVLARARGMYALAWLDIARAELLLARDPLGIKPLLCSEHQGCVLFASEMRGMVSMLGRVPAPDAGVLSAYLTTIRTSMGERTMFQGVRTVRAGEALRWSLRNEVPALRSQASVWRAPVREKDCSIDEAGERVRECVVESVRAHLISDVPVCSMLSGGLDSAIITRCVLKTPGRNALRTYVADASGSSTGDASHARDLAGEWGLAHRELRIDQEGFLARWHAMVACGELGIPLSTPNETAILEVARAAREDGQIVALSGEGADELFGGYTLVLDALARALAERPHESPEAHATLALRSGAWLGDALKPQVLTSEAWEAAEHDEGLLAWATGEMRGLIDRTGDEGLGLHLRWQRRVNLGGLLQRLDSACMLASVEGRTPLADVRVASLAESLPLPMLYDGVAGKRALRAAFAGVLPARVIARPKASFPLPFQQWMDPLASMLLESRLLSWLVRGPVLAMIAQRPGEHWNLAWPLLNLSLWERCWWPEHSFQSLQTAGDG